MEGEFSQKQIQVLKEVVGEAVKSEVKIEVQQLRTELKAEARELKGSLRQEIKDEFRLNNDLILQEIRATESRLDKKIETAKTEVLEGVAQMLDISITPQLDDHDTRITELEQKAVV